jgi:mono/diheme cytochrome c family protein
VLLLAVACGSDDTGSALATKTGAELFQLQACATCHARDGAGTNLGPTLHGKKAGWTRENLVAYLKDPVGYAAKEPRLKAQGSKFSQAMPTYKMLPDAMLEKLADHVLAMP